MAKRRAVRRRIDKDGAGNATRSNAAQGRGLAQMSEGGAERRKAVALRGKARRCFAWQGAAAAMLGNAG